QDRQRLTGARDIPNDWAGKLAIVGSTAIGNDLTDRGATPLAEDTFLASQHWNVINSILMGRHVHQSPEWLNLLLIVGLASLSAFFTTRLKILLASALVF